MDQLPDIIFETERLLVRRFTTEDAPFIYRLVNEPAWLQYIGDRHVRSVEDARQYLINGALKSYTENGFGPWLVQVKQTGISAGMCGLFKRDYLEEADIGFAFLPEYNGQGYGYEVASATLRYARENLGMDRFAAFTAKDNYASIKLLMKIGFAEAGVLVLDGEELFLFKTS
jgi:RimJ/RimL family protein N-acetyltransferase